MRALSLVLVPLLALTAPAADNLLFVYFRSNGETGNFYALSNDGLEWREALGGRAAITPRVPGELMRDPCLALGPDKTWHLVWTWDWGRTKEGKLQIGHATSRDLLAWSAHQAIPILPDQPRAMNVWAPELTWDAKRKRWIVYWSTAIEGKFPETQQPEKRNNHRTYALTTADFKTFSAPRVLFDPGHSVIDATIVPDGKRYLMFYKDERSDPLGKNLWWAWSDDVEGPWRDRTGPFTESWNEGPTAVKLGREWFVWFDYYRKPAHYEVLTSADLKSWRNRGGELKMPPGVRHGTVVRIDARTAARLR